MLISWRKCILNLVNNFLEYLNIPIIYQYMEARQIPTVGYHKGENGL